MNTLSVKSCISFGWQQFKARPWFFVGVVAILFGISLLSGALQSTITAILGKELGGGVAYLVSLVVNVFISMGMLSVYLKAHDAVAAPTFSTLWNPGHFWKFLGAQILVGIAVIVGLILLIVPGIIVALMLSFVGWIVIEQGSAPIEAMKESARMTKGHRWQLLWLGLALLAINLLGLIVVVVGLAVSIPVSMLALAHAYRILSGSAHVADMPPAAEPVSALPA